MTATYSYDFADRQETLDLQVGADPVQPLVTGSSYLPSGPLASLALGNGATETRDFDGRYVPETIQLDALTPRRWDYTTDGVGNILEIATQIGCLDEDLMLANQTVTGTETFTNCAGIQAGPAFSVEPGGSTTFTAGTRVGLGDGFSVKSGASFVAGTDPSMAGEVETRTYTYQDHQYFLTSGDGPWGSLEWTYDRIGNRLTETRDGVTDTYAYVGNGGGGNTAILDQITLGAGGTRDYQFGAAGQLEQVTAGANQVDFVSDDEGRLADLSRPVAGEAVDVLYDGRSFMLSTADPATGAVTEPTYTSEGLLCALRRQETPTSPDQRFTYLYFAGRPVAQLEMDGSGGESLHYLILDHLGTPVVGLDEARAEVWDSGFEPFGRDPEEATPDGALANGVFLRFPGQWEDGRWAEVSLGAEVFYNVHRWYLVAAGMYSSPDLRPALRAEIPFVYAASRPTFLIDSTGLQPFPPPVPLRDPFKPPVDPSFGSGPWGKRPNGECCDKPLLEARADRTGQIVRELDEKGYVETRPPAILAGKVGGYIERGSYELGDGWYLLLSLEPLFEPHCDSVGDPCLRYCCRVHEWFHFSDRRPLSYSWSAAETSRFTEMPAHQIEGLCLQSFLSSR